MRRNGRDENASDAQPGGGVCVSAVFVLNPPSDADALRVNDAGCRPPGPELHSEHLKHLEKLTKKCSPKSSQKLDANKTFLSKYLLKIRLDMSIHRLHPYTFLSVNGSLLILAPDAPPLEGDGVGIALLGETR